MDLVPPTKERQLRANSGHSRPIDRDRLLAMNNAAARTGTPALGIHLQLSARPLMFGNIPKLPASFAERIGTADTDVLQYTLVEREEMPALPCNF
jgi:hypothetical protein